MTNLVSLKSELFGWWQASRLQRLVVGILALATFFLGLFPASHFGLEIVFIFIGVILLMLAILGNRMSIESIVAGSFGATLGIAIGHFL
jgi:hypothetical protein